MMPYILLIEQDDEIVAAAPDELTAFGGIIALACVATNTQPGDWEPKSLTTDPDGCLRFVAKNGILETHARIIPVGMLQA